MAEFAARDVSIDEAAGFLGVSGSTIRARLRSGELRRARDVAGGVHVRFVPLEDWLRLPDAAGLLGVSTSTLRAACAHGEIVCRRVEGRWQVRLISVLEDARCDPRAVALFSGAPPPPREEPAPARREPPALRRRVHLALPVEDAERLERLRDEHGSVTLVVCEGLRVLEEQPASPGEVEELYAEHRATRERLARVEGEHQALVERSRDRLVDEVYCPSCERLVPIEEFGDVVLEDDTVELVHEPHRHRQANRLRGGTVAARRRPQAAR